MECLLYRCSFPTFLKMCLFGVSLISRSETRGLMKGTSSVLETYHRAQEGPCISPLAPLKALFFIWKRPSVITLSPAFPQGYQLRQIHWQLVPHKMGSSSIFKLIRIFFLLLSLAKGRRSLTAELLIPHMLLTSPFR